MDKNAQREIWKYDQKIGGYGGYAAPLNPTINPFNLSSIVMDISSVKIIIYEISY